MHPTRPRSPRPSPALPFAVLVIGVLALTAALLPVAATAQDQPVRIGGDPDPVLAAIELHQATQIAPAARVVLGRSDVFPDNLAATALAGADGALLLTDGSPDARLRPEVAAELDRTLAEATCTDPTDGPTVFLAGGTAAISQAVEDQLAGERFCVQRLAGDSRIQTAVAVADAVADPSGTVVLARSDDWADAGAVGAWAASTRSRILVTPTAELHPATAAALQRFAPDRIVLVGGTAAMSDAVADAAADIAPVVRVAGETRDQTAVAIAVDLWGRTGGPIALADGYDELAWTYLFAGAAFAAGRSLPVLYTAAGALAPATAAHLDAVPADEVALIGPTPTTDPPAPSPGEPPTGPVANLDAVRVALQDVTVLGDSPLMLKARPGVGELWVAERSGRLRAIGGGADRVVLDISSTVSVGGERGLLGFAFDPDGSRVFTSTPDPAGDSVVDVFEIVGDAVDAASRRQVIRVSQPASNHNGGDLAWGPDDMLWWSLGDGGGGGDTHEQGQRPDTLLASMVRIDVRGDQGYAIPTDNPFADGVGGAPELFAFGLRNPFRFAFDALTGDLYIADVGQSAREEINVVEAGTGAGSNFGWPIFEGTAPFRGGSLPDHVPPVWELQHGDGNCSITGGVVYRGEAIPELTGAYLYADFCNESIHAIVVEDGQVAQDTDLGVRVPRPVGFGVDHEGEVHVLGLGGQIAMLIPG